MCSENRNPVEKRGTVSSVAVRAISERGGWRVVYGTTAREGKGNQRNLLP